MEMENFDSVILDIDGTIWNTTGIVAVAWNKAIDASGFVARKVNAQILQGEFGKTMDVITRDLWPELSRAEREVLLSLCTTEEHIALKENNLDITYPGVVETVNELCRSVPFYVVSNCEDGYIQLMLEKTGLEPCIKDFECYGRTLKGKAENIILLKDRNRLTRPLYVGDTKGDADACAQAGVPFAWAAYGFGEVDSYFARLEKFADLKQVLGL